MWRANSIGGGNRRFEEVVGSVKVGKDEKRNKRVSSRRGRCLTMRVLVR